MTQTLKPPMMVSECFEFEFMLEMHHEFVDGQPFEARWRIHGAVLMSETQPRAD
jgi:hypothetical protein